MSRPTYAFKCSSHTWIATGAPGVYRAEPGGAEIRLSVERQEIPAGVRSPALERAVAAWGQLVQEARTTAPIRGTVAR